MRCDLSKAAFPIMVTLVCLSIAQLTWLALSGYVAVPFSQFPNEEWTFINHGLDQVHGFSGTACWWTGPWCGPEKFWRPLTSHVFWGERLIWPKGLMLPRQIVSLALHLVFVGLGGWLTWRLTGRRWLALLTVWLFAGFRPHLLNAVFPHLRPVINLLADPNSIPDSLVGIAMIASLLLLTKGRWIASFAAAMISVGFDELGFMTWPLALVVLIWINRERLEWGNLLQGIRKYRLPMGLWTLGLGMLMIVHFLAVGHGFEGGSNGAWFGRAVSFLGGPIGVDLITRNFIRIFVAMLLFASIMSLRRTSIIIRLAAVLASFGIGILLDAHLQRVPLEVSLVRMLSYSLDLRTILICSFWLLVAWEARHDWQTIALGMSLCFVAALPLWTVTYKSDHTLYVPAFFMEIVVAAALCRSAAVSWAYAGRVLHKEPR